MRHPVKGDRGSPVFAEPERAPVENEQYWALSAFSGAQSLAQIVGEVPVHPPRNVGCTHPFLGRCLDGGAGRLGERPPAAAAIIVAVGDVHPPRPLDLGALRDDIDDVSRARPRCGRRLRRYGLAWRDMERTRHPVEVVDVGQRWKGPRLGQLDNTISEGLADPYAASFL